MFGLQALVNIGVVLGSLPTKGLPLPFISYGGTSLVMSLFIGRRAGQHLGAQPRAARRGCSPRAPARQGANRRHGRRPAHRRGGRGPARRAPKPRPQWIGRAAVAGADRGRRDGRPSLSRASPIAEEITAVPAARWCSSGTARGLETHAGARGRLSARAPQGQRPQAHGRCGDAARAAAPAGAFLESRADAAPLSARRGAGRRRLRLGAAGVRGGAARAIRPRSRSRTASPASPTGCSAASSRRVFVAFDERVAPAFRAGRSRRRQPGAAKVPRARPRGGRGRRTAPAGRSSSSGGSQGARAVNELASGHGAGAGRARPAAAHRPPDGPRRSRAHAGPLRRASGTRGGSTSGPSSTTCRRCWPTPRWWSRAPGALTLAELAIMRRPAILIPLPTAADDHQTSNARAFEGAGAAVVLPQSDASATRLGDLVDQILGDPARHARMAVAMGGSPGPRPPATSSPSSRPSPAAGLRARVRSLCALEVWNPAAKRSGRGALERCRGSDCARPVAHRGEVWNPLRVPG